MLNAVRNVIKFFVCDVLKHEIQFYRILGLACIACVSLKSEMRKCFECDHKLDIEILYLIRDS